MKAYLVAACVLVATVAKAQEFKPFKVNVSVGYAHSTGTGLSGGALFSIEPRYGLNDHFDLGLRLETAILSRGITTNGTTTTSNGAGFASGLLTATYFVGEGGFRPFVGVGAGLFAIGSSGSVQLPTQPTRTDFPFTSYNTMGGMLRAGFKTGHFVAAAEYNAIPEHTYTLTAGSFTTKSSYLGVKIGFDIGGGRH